MNKQVEKAAQSVVDDAVARYGVGSALARYRRVMHEYTDKRRPQWLTRTVAMLTAMRIGEQFADELELQLTPDEWEEMKRRNQTAKYTTACASHDFCDANMPMASAFEAVTGHDVDAESEADTELWNAAWNYARQQFIGQPHPGGIR